MWDLVLSYKWIYNHCVFGREVWLGFWFKLQIRSLSLPFSCYWRYLSLSAPLLVPHLPCYLIDLKPDVLINEIFDNQSDFICVRLRKSRKYWQLENLCRNWISEIRTMAANGNSQTTTKTPPLPSPLRFSKFYQVICYILFYLLIGLFLALLLLVWCTCQWGHVMQISW